jgi:hypothetical protein
MSFAFNALYPKVPVGSWAHPPTANSIPKAAAVAAVAMINKKTVVAIR